VHTNQTVASSVFPFHNVKKNRSKKTWKVSNFVRGVIIKKGSINKKVLVVQKFHIFLFYFFNESKKHEIFFEESWEEKDTAESPPPRSEKKSLLGGSAGASLGIQNHSLLPGSKARKSLWTTLCSNTKEIKKEKYHLLWIFFIRQVFAFFKILKIFFTTAKKAAGEINLQRKNYKKALPFERRIEELEFNKEMWPKYRQIINWEKKQFDFFT